MTHKRRILVPLLAVILAGCGGSQTLTGPHTAAGAHAISGAQKELIAKADPICAKASAKRAAANASLGTGASLSSPKTLFAIAQTGPGVAAAEKQAVAKLRELKAPASLEHDWQTLLAGLQTLARATAKLTAYAKENNPQGAKELVAGTQSTRTQLLAIATRDGFTNCGRND